LIRYFEQAGLIPCLHFINGVEGHVAVLDDNYLRTSSATLSKEAVEVDAIISTIGFPL